MPGGEFAEMITMSMEELIAFIPPENFDGMTENDSEWSDGEEV